MNRTLFALIGFYVLFQLLQFLHTYYGTQYIMENNMAHFKSYYDYLQEKPLYAFYSSVIVYLKYLIFGMLIFVKTKLSSN
jgi:hypothetical protein